MAIYSSPYRRARETVEPLAARMNLPIREMSELRERSLGRVWEGDWPATMRTTWEDFSFAYPEGGETNDEVMARAQVVLRALCDRHPGDAIVVATHGNLLVLLLRALDPTKGYEFWRKLSVPDVYRVVIAEGKIFELRRLWEETGSS